MHDHCNTPFPVLWRNLPPKNGSPGESEDDRMSVFTAAALAISQRYSAGGPPGGGLTTVLEEPPPQPNSMTRSAGATRLRENTKTPMKVAARLLLRRHQRIVGIAFSWASIRLYCNASWPNAAHRRTCSPIRLPSPSQYRNSFLPEFGRPPATLPVISNNLLA